AAFLDPRSRCRASLPSVSPSSRKVRPNDRWLSMLRVWLRGSRPFVLRARGSAHAGWRGRRGDQSSRDIEPRSLPQLARSYPRDFTFYVADPISSIRALAFQFPSLSLNNGRRSACPTIQWHEPSIVAAYDNRICRGWNSPPCRVRLLNTDPGVRQRDCEFVLSEIFGS